MKKQCPDCGSVMVEVRKALCEGRIVNQYPKPICEPNLVRTYNEYRFFCEKCKKEWIYETIPHCRHFAELPSDPQFKYSQKKKLLIMRKNWLKKFKDNWRNSKIDLK